MHDQLSPAHVVPGEHFHPGRGHIERKVTVITPAVLECMAKQIFADLLVHEDPAALGFKPMAPAVVRCDLAYALQAAHPVCETFGARLVNNEMRISEL